MGWIKAVFSHFSVWTSASGLPHVAKSSNKCTCLFWTSALIVCVVMFIYQMTCLIMNYLDYPVTVDTKLKFQELVFPVTTVCNLSPFKLSKVKNDEILSLVCIFVICVQFGITLIHDTRTLSMFDYEMRRLIRVVMKPHIFTFSLFNVFHLLHIETYKAAIGEDSTKDDPKWNLKVNANDTPMEIQTRAKTKLNYITAKMTDEEIKAFGTTLDEFIMSCTYNELECNKNFDFQVYVDRTFGVCFQFNTGQENRTTFISRRVGSNNGLRLMLNIGLDEYLPISEAVGVRLIISNQNEQIFPDAFGYNAPTGLKTSFSVKYTLSNRLGYPYSQCVDESAGNYSVEHCYRQCFQDFIVYTCGCGDPRFPLKDNQTYCGIEKYDCVVGVNNDTLDLNDTAANSAFDMKNTCNCPQPCIETSFTLSVSNAVWPARSYTPYECTQSNNTFGGNLTECLAWYSENTLMVEVYYERLNYQLFNENPAYPIISLISDFGGQIGLWIGFSVITMIECLFIPFMLIRSFTNKDEKRVDSARPKTNESLITSKLEEEDDNMFDHFHAERDLNPNQRVLVAPRYSIHRQSEIFRVPHVTHTE